MVDTIHFTVNDFEVTGKAALTIRPGPIDNRTGKQYQGILYFPVSAGYCSPVIGEKAFYNGRIVLAEIFKPRFSDKAILFIRVSAPKCLRPDNYQLVEGRDLHVVYRKVEEELRDAGIFFSPASSKIKRLDLARNILTPEIPREYLEVLRLIEKAKLSRLNWGTTFLLKNGQQEICIYDKIAELKSQGRNTSGYPGNVLRIEQRLMNRQKIESSLEITTGDDLIKYYTQCMPWYQENLKRLIFHLSPGSYYLPGNGDFKSELELFKQKYGNRWLNAYIHFRGIEAITNDYELKYICQIIKEIELQEIEQPDKKDFHRVNTKLSRFRKEIEAAREFKMMITDNQRLNKSYAQLYNELKELVLCA